MAGAGTSAGFEPYSAQPDGSAGALCAASRMLPSGRGASGTHGQVVLATATISNRVDDGPGGQRSAVATNVESIGMTALGCGTIMLITGEIDVTLPSITLSG